jgi:hypothetical protein
MKEKKNKKHSSNYFYLLHQIQTNKYPKFVTIRIQFQYYYFTNPPKVFGKQFFAENKLRLKIFLFFVKNKAR